MSSLPAELDRLLHDLRGPLNSAVMHLEVLRRVAGPDPAAKPTLDTLHEQLQRLAAMLPAAFNVVALELGPTRALDLRDLVVKAIGEAGTPEVVVAGEAWPRVRGDENLLTTAVAHLLRNAAEATRAAPTPRPSPRVSAAVTDDGQVALSVRDWGVGFKTTNVKVVVRLTSAANTLRPRGVGLLSTERIARLHGGTLRLHAPGDGAEVILTLPVVA